MRLVKLCEPPAVGCYIITSGQYLKHTKEHLSVARVYHPDEFALLKTEG